MKTLVRIVVAVVLMGAIVWLVGGVGEIVGLMTAINPMFALLVLIVGTLDRVLMTYKWVWLLRGRGLRLPFFQAMKVYCASQVWGLFLPSTIGADAIRAVSVSRSGLDSDEVVASIVVERMVGFLSALLLAVFSLVLLYVLGVRNSQLVLIWWMAAAMIAGGTIIFAASFSKWAFDLLHGRILHRFHDTRVMTRLRGFHSTYQEYQDDRKKLGVFFGLTFGEQLLPILFTWLVALSLGIEVSLLFMSAALPLSLLIARIPISFDGLGVLEGTLILILSLAGVSTAEAVAIAFSGRILQVATWLPWWVAHVMPSGSIRPPRAVMEEN